MINYEDFAKLDLKIATILTAEKVEKSEKLVKLIVKIGEEQRTLVAGIGKFYDPVELINKRIVVLANLEPRTLKGIESQGMLLAAESPEGELVLLTADKNIADGAKVG